VEAVQNLLERGMKAGEFRQADPLHTAISLAALVVSYFSMAPMLHRLGYPDPYAEATLKQRKQEVFDFVRHGLFVNPNTPTT
jgi:AcrR family transcriptional regulator